MADKKFNLIDEPWIPFADHDLASLSQAFSMPLPASTSGSPLTKITLFKFLLSIAQAAFTPKDDKEWLDMGSQGLGDRALAYLKKQHDKFWLYGDQPFLQFPACAKAERKSCGTVMPEVASGNTTWLSHQQLEWKLTDAEKALLLLQQMSLCLGGKKADNKLVFSGGYEKTSSSKPGPAVCHKGLLHSFLLGDNLLQSLWLNLLTAEDDAMTV